MEDLSNKLNKPTIQKFERKKVIVNIYQKPKSLIVWAGET